MVEFGTISEQQLSQKIARERPDNQARRDSYALVNVLDPEHFAKEHIPQSINIPRGQEEEFERRFDHDKEIIVYCASSECDASPKTAETLALRGFSAVSDFEAGIEGWRNAGHRLDSGSV